MTSTFPRRQRSKRTVLCALPALLTLGYALVCVAYGLMVGAQQ